MAQNNIPRWQEQVERIFRDQYQGDELKGQIAQACELLEIADSLESPEGAVAQVLKMVSEELRPLTAVYVAFRLGVAVERSQNANRA